MAPDIKYALVPVFLACSVFGGYATLGSVSKSGLGNVLKAVASGSRSTLLGAPEPFKRVYTGVAAIDSRLVVPVAFFSAMIDGDVPPENFLFYLWGMAQFAAGWTIMLLESVRTGNRGLLVSYASVYGLVLQNITWTVTLPIWLSIHLLTSPVARIGGEGGGPLARRILGAHNPWDAILLPLSVVQAFIVPAVFMSLPTSLLSQSAAAHYGWNAVWQVFPLWNVLILALLRRTPLAGGGHEERGRKVEKTTAADQAHPPPATSSIYNFAIVLAVCTHLPVLVLALLPSPLRSSLASSAAPLSNDFASLIRAGTFANIFVPRSWPSNPHPPSVIPTAYASGDLAPLATQFLQYDLLVASIPFLLWALYLRQSAIKDASLRDALAKAVYWLVLGGPHAAVAALLKERDAAIFDGQGRLSKKAR